MWMLLSVSFFLFMFPSKTILILNTFLFIEREDAGLYIARFTFEGLPEPHDCQVKFKCKSKCSSVFCECKKFEKHT